MPAKNIINAAIKAAKMSDNEYKMAAVLFKGGAIIRIATNSTKTIQYRKKFFKFDPTRHCEMAVMHNVPRDIIKECSIFIVRINNHNQLASGKPCSACIAALKEAGVSKAYFTNYLGGIDKINPQNVDIELWTKEPPLVEKF